MTKRLPRRALKERWVSSSISFNQDDGVDPLLKAALAHLWFVTIHPFEDRSGRIADLQFARS